MTNFDQSESGEAEQAFIDRSAALEHNRPEGAAAPEDDTAEVRGYAMPEPKPIVREGRVPIPPGHIALKGFDDVEPGPSEW